MAKTKLKTVPDRTTLDSLEKGYYVLTHDVKNPKPNRRYKDSPVIGQDIVPAGLRVQAVKYPIRDEDDVVKKYRTELRHYGTGDMLSDFEECPLAQMVAPLLKPADPVVGHFVNDGNHDPRAVLAALVDQGKVTLEDLKATHEYLDAIGDGPDETGEDWSQWLRNHWIDRLGW